MGKNALYSDVILVQVMPAQVFLVFGPLRGNPPLTLEAGHFLVRTAFFKGQTTV